MPSRGRGGKKDWGPGWVRQEKPARRTEEEEEGKKKSEEEEEKGAVGEEKVSTHCGVGARGHYLLGNPTHHDGFHLH